jgi:glycerol kinase
MEDYSINMASGKNYILAIDQGTTGSTAVVCDDQGKVVSKGYHEIRQIYPKPGWVEQDPQEYIHHSLAAAGDAIGKASISVQQIKALGITNQRETTIIWDRRTGQPVYNAIVWQCRRTAPMCEDLKKRGLEAMVRAKTGLPIDAYFSATKIRWILDNIPDGQQRAESGDLLFGTVDTWLVWNLTGGAVYATDFSNASRTMLFNIHSLEWDNDLLEMLNIPNVILPRVKPSSGIFGDTLPRFFDKQPLPVASIAGDQQAALFGEACYQSGMAKNTYGTGSFVMLNTGKKPVPSQSGMVTTIAWGLRDEVAYALEGSIFITGAAVQWLRDGLGIIASAAETEELARSVSDNGGVYFVPAFTGLGAPYWDMYARGTIIGITGGVKKAHLVRATLEAFAYQAKDVVEAMQADAGIRIPLLRVDGGGAANKFLLQFQADILGIPIERTVGTDVTALGAAYLAGLAVGVWKNVDEIAKLWTAAELFEPKMSSSRKEELYSRWKLAVERSRGWAAH